MILAWAQKEWQNLVRVHRAGLPAPVPLLLKDNVIVMSLLSDVDGEGAGGRDSVWAGVGCAVPAPQLRHAPLASVAAWNAAYAQTVAVMYALHNWCHLVHADLSEYNL